MDTCKIKSWLLMRASFIALLLGVAATVNAEDRFYLPDFEIAADETKKLAIQFESDNVSTADLTQLNYVAFQFDLCLPEGLTLEQKDGKPNLNFNGDRVGDHEFSAKAQEDGSLRVVGASLTSASFKKTSGDFIYFTVTAAADFVGNQTLMLKNVMLSDGNGELAELADATTTVTGVAATVSVTGITLSQTTVAITEGTTVTLTATVTPDNATDKTVTWSTSDAAVATVENGVVTAVAAGTATITATAGNQTATCVVTVAKATIDVEGIALNESSISLVEGKNFTLVATVTPDNATDKTVTWSTSDAAVATVENGVVTAVAAGTATITAKAGDKTAICVVTVAKATIDVEGIALNESSISLVEGKNFTLVATVTPDNATDKTVTWTTTDANVATVENGVVTAVAAGTATITATAGNQTATCVVTVEKATIDVEGITLNESSISLVEGKNFTLVATVTPDSATDKTVTWTTSDANVATVENGVVTAVAAGTATITATAGDKKVTCEITVAELVIPVETISLNCTSAALLEEEVLTLVATVTPVNATNKTVTWNSSDEKVATVKDGVVTAVAAGTATITATAGDKTATCEVTVAELVVSLNRASAALVEGESVTLVATVTPDFVKDKTVTWNSSNTAVATVDASGKVTAVGIGTATITATVGDKKATCEITVAELVIPVETISLNLTSAALLEEEVITLVATVTPDDATDKIVTWNSSNTAVATVDANGKVTAVAAGTATITATAGDKTATCEVTVAELVVSLNRASAALVEGESVTLVATVTPDFVKDKTVTWNSSNTAVATVDASGKVTAVGIGTATITATVGDKKATCEITVAELVIPVEGISLNLTSAALLEDEVVTLVAIVTPDDATDKIVAWSSSDEKVATVKDGVITAVAAGTATITATAGDKTATCEVTVAELVVSLNRASAALVEGESVTIVAMVTPDYVKDKTVTWSSSNTAVATVDASGKVTAVGIGTATITATVGGKTATCEIIVAELVVPVEGISLNRTSAALVEGETLTLVATVTPDNATDKTVTWSSSNTSVATVDATGKVTAVAVGTATITALAGDKTATCEVTVDKKVIAVEGISLDVTSVELTRGDSLTVVATVYPEDATDKTVVWSSSDEAVACVNSDGTIVALSAGSAIITATSNGYEASCVVVVSEVNGISFILMDGSWPVDVYDMTGRMVRKSAYSIADLEEGFYLINGRKYFINK